ncbi:hypothetical protein BGW80DRAFT_1249620 [Lactifluus volemus]|nr:hypothetical protein BGW80DRAFT_1249620 [Lactifluus volemus]
MSSRSSITGELPIDSYFGSTGRTSGNKENKSLKRRQPPDDAERTSTKQRLRINPKDTNPKTQENLDVEVVSQANASGTTSVPAPVTVEFNCHIQEALTISSTPAEDTGRPEGVVSVLPTPQSGSLPSSQWSIDEQAPDSQASMEVNSDPFLPQQEPKGLILLPLATLDAPSRSPTIPSLAPVKSGVSALPTFISPGRKSSWKDLPSTGDISNMTTRPPSLSSSPRSASLSSNGYGPRHQSQSSQFVPTSQFDEIELNFPSGNIAASPSHPPRMNHSEASCSAKRLDPGPLQDQESHPEAIVTEESLSKDPSYKLPILPSSPLTPLTPSSSSSAMGPNADAVGENASSSQHTRDKILGSSPPPPPIADPQWGGTSQHLAELDFPAEDLASDEDETFVRSSPAPLRLRSADVRNTSTPASNTPSTSTSTLHISHAKLRSIPAPTIELDSDGEEICSSDGGFSPPATSQISGVGRSYFDLVGTLPSEVGDFLDMVGTDTFSDV